MSTKNQDQGCGVQIIVALFTVIGLMFGFLVGMILYFDHIGVGPDLGLPISNLELDSSGTVITFQVGSTLIQANLENAYDRPPNLDRATHVFIDDNQLEFTDSENNRLFDVYVWYVPPLIFEED